jgi:hypothetical protein
MTTIERNRERVMCATAARKRVSKSSAPLVTSALVIAALALVGCEGEEDLGPSTSLGGGAGFGTTDSGVLAMPGGATAGTGGVTSTGGVAGAGGAGTAGGVAGTGGAGTTGGVAGTGGLSGTGGFAGTAAGGVAGTGGLSGTGGTAGTGGIASTGGPGSTGGTDAGAVGGTGGGGGTTGGGTATRPDQGMGDGKDVITIGDSWMNLDGTVGIQQSLEKASRRDYRNYGVPGTLLLDESIPSQYVAAKGEGPIKTVIMTAGGNDVLQDPLLLAFECPDGTFSDACKKRIDDVGARLGSFWAEMSRDGVMDVVIISYTSKALFGGYTQTQAYSREKITPICDKVPAPLRCSSVETDEAVPDVMLREGIHPDDASYDKIGAAVWAHMQKLGMRR